MLRYTDAGQGRREAALTGERQRLTVGRAEENDVALTSDGQVSRVHAVIEWVGGHWTISDDGLSGGTFVNGERVAGRRRLEAGDGIRVGGSLVTFHDFSPRRGAGPSPSRRPTSRSPGSCSSARTR